MIAVETPKPDPTGGASVLGDGDPPVDGAAPVEAAVEEKHGGEPDRFSYVRDSFAGFRDQALGQARDYAVTGKETLSTTFEGYAETVRDTAQQIEDKAGPQVARYAHQAADFLEDAAETLRTKDVEELLDEARDLVRRSPALAIGAAAAMGFALSRFLKATSERLEPDFVPPSRATGEGRSAAHDV